MYYLTSRDIMSWIPIVWASIGIIFNNRILKTRQLFRCISILAYSNISNVVPYLQRCRLVLMMSFGFVVSCFVLQTRMHRDLAVVFLTADKSSVSILSSINLKNLGMYMTNDNYVFPLFISRVGYSTPAISRNGNYMS